MPKLQLNVILSDYLGRVLLLSEPQVNQLSLPSALLEPGTLPADTLAESVRLRTGIIAMPVRLTGIYADTGGLMLSFRAVQRGGTIVTTDSGEPTAGFFNTSPTPQPMTAANKQQLQDAMRHSGGPPVYAPAAISLGERLFRVLGIGDPQPADHDWEVSVTLVDRDSAGNVMWQHGPDESLLRLPSAAVPAGSLPNVIAGKLVRSVAGSASDPILSGIYLHPHAPIIEFCYRGGAMDGNNNSGLLTAEGDLSAYDTGHIRQAQQALRGVDDLDIAILPEVPASVKGSANDG